MMSKEKFSGKSAAVWVDSSPGLQYKYKSALVAAAREEETFAKALSALPSAERALLDADPGAEYRFLLGKGIEPLPMWDERYPERLTHLSRPPLVLYARGNLGLLGERVFAVTGSRKTPPDMLALTERAAEELSGRFAVLTGISAGAERAALRGAAERGRAICLLPMGFGHAESAERWAVTHAAERGLVLAEKPYRAVYDGGVYPRHSRLLAALSEGVLIAGADRKSGALAAAEAALELGREVFAFPYHPSAHMGEGCNDLIRAGAGLAVSGGDILSALGFPEGATDFRALPQGLAGRIYAALRESGGMTADRLAEELNAPFSELISALSMLELDGRAARLPGNVYKAVD